MKKEFVEAVTAPQETKASVSMMTRLKKKQLLNLQMAEAVTMKTGAVAIAAITSCTNTSNPSVLVGAGLVAKKAVEMG